MDRAEIRRRETAIWDRMLDSWLGQFWIQAILKLAGAVGGGFVAGMGGGMDGGLFDGSNHLTRKAVTIAIGTGISGISALILLFADRERPHLVADVRYDLAALRELVDRYDDMITKETWRVACDTAIHIMLEAVEDTLINPGVSISEDIQGFLFPTKRALLDALGIGFDEDYTISVFRRDDAAQVMTRVADEWYDEEDAEYDRRVWRRGQGFTGQSWALRKTIGMPDANQPSARQTYSLKPEEYPEDFDGFGIRPDDERYASFACVPIMVGSTDNPATREPWGILTVTSDAIGRFDALDSDTPGGDNLPILRLTAALMALLVAAKAES